jgi:molybdopterin molybdotransferase
MELFNVISMDEAKHIINNKFSHELRSEKVSVLDCIGRFSYEDVKAGCNTPEFRRSTVDGFAINSRDVFGASEAMPSILELVGEVFMGEVPPGKIEASGQCLYVPTGGMLPEGSDSVVMVEYSSKLDEKTILIDTTIAPGDNVIQVGEDISIGETVINTGERLRPYEIGVLSSLGIKEILVFKKPVIGIISTGDEVIPSDNEPSPGQVRDINTNLLWSSVLKDEAEPISYGIIKDDYELLKSTVDRAINECDIVLISGGSSVGTKDHTLKVISSLEDGGVLAHGISVKPGKPTIIGKAKGKIIFGLPGHPLACSIIYKILVKSYIDKLLHHNETIFGTNAEFTINYHKAKGREEYLPVSLDRVNGKIIARPMFGKSGLITVFSRAWGYVNINKNVEGLRAGEQVEVFRF